MKYSYLISLGSNMEPKRENLIHAIRLMMDLGQIKAVGSVVQSEPIGISSKELFLNTAVLIDGNYGPEELLIKLKQIEKGLGRKVRDDGSRPIDLDIVCGLDCQSKKELLYNSETLTIPHTKARIRDFVILPAYAISPEMHIGGIPLRVIAKNLQNNTLECEHLNISECLPADIPRINIASIGKCNIAKALEAHTTIILTGVLPEKLVQIVRRESENFFGQGKKYLSQFKRKSIDAPGYTEPGGESVRDIPINERHFFDVFRKSKGEMSQSKCTLFQIATQAMYDILENTGEDLVTRIGENIGYEKIKDDVKNGRHMLRIAEYFISNKNNSVLFPRHRDFGLLSLFVGGAEPGLQVFLNDRWFDAVLGPTDVLVGPGTTMRFYSNNIKPLIHRVVVQSDKRLSIAFFTEPNPQTILPDGSLAGERLKKCLSKIAKQ